MSKLQNEVRNTLRVRHYALKTEKTYLQWIKRFILFHNKTHPLKMGKVEVESLIYTHVVNRGALGARSPLDRMN
jgi:hypothetical protein